MTHEELDRLTAERMADPRPGDRFHEMYSFWVEVVARVGHWVVSLETGDGVVRLRTVEEFAARFAYGTIPGYWVSYRDRNGSTEPAPDDAVDRLRWLAGLIRDRQRMRAGTLAAGAAI